MCLFLVERCVVVWHSATCRIFHYVNSLKIFYSLSLYFFSSITDGEAVPDSDSVSRDGDDVTSVSTEAQHETSSVAKTKCSQSLLRQLWTDLLQM